MIRITDDHAHLLIEPISKDLDEYIEKNKKAGVIAIITNSSSIDNLEKTIELTKKYDIVYGALGIHPLHINEIKEDTIGKVIEKVKSLLKERKIVAIGEVGLDFTIENHKEQEDLFQRFIELSEKTGKPLIVHSRKAELRVIEMLESSNAKIVMHYFTGRKWLVKRIINNGWMLSIPTNIIKLQQLQQNVELAPMEQLLTETDAPWLNPYGQDRYNESRFIIETLKKMAEIKKIELEEMAEIIVNNFKKTYGLQDL